jgi:hypothetical protein
MCEIRNFIAVLKKPSTGPYEKNEMSEAYSTYGGEERRIQDFGGEA